MVRDCVFTRPLSKVNTFEPNSIESSGIAKLDLIGCPDSFHGLAAGLNVLIRRAQISSPRPFALFDSVS